MQGNALTHRSLQIKPIATVYTLLTPAKQHRMHLAGKQIRQGKSFYIERIGLQQKLLLCLESQQRNGVNFKFDLECLWGANGQVNDGGRWFQNGLNDRAGSGFALHLDLHANSLGGKLLLHTPQVGLQGKSRVALEQRQIQILGKPRQLLKYAKAGVAIKCSFANKATAKQPRQGKILHYLP